MRRFKVPVLILILIFSMTVFLPGVQAQQDSSQEAVYISGEISCAGKSLSITLDRVEIGPGVKVPPGQSSIYGDRDSMIECSFTDGNNKVIKEILIENPLLRTVEYPGGNGGKLGLAKVRVEKAPLEIIAAYDTGMKFLRVSMPDSGKLSKSVIIDIGNELKKSSLAAAAADRFEVEKIVDNGPDQGNITFAVMGDGYTRNEQSKFIKDAKSLIDYLLKDPAYQTYKNRFNVYAVKAVSNVTGAAADPNSLIDNYFGSSFNIYGIERLLAPTKTSRVYEVLKNHVPQYNQAIMIVNSSTYGGSGGDFATTSTNTSSYEILVHELGHSFVGLADEYWAGTQYAGEKINMTKNNDPQTVKWKKFLGVNGVGIYEYESPGNGWYRPHENCKMRFLGPAFCEVCMDAHKNKIKSMLENITPSPTRTSAPVTPTPTGTTGINISGYISPDFEGSGEAAGLLKSGFKVELAGSDKSIQTDSKGYFSLKTAPFTKDTSIKISKPGFLTRTSQPFKATADVLIGSVQSPVELWAGDIPNNGVQDGAINMTDIMLTAKFYGTIKGDGKYSLFADINMDGSVNMTDIMLEARHFGKVGADYPQMPLN